MDKLYYKIRKQSVELSGSKEEFPDLHISMSTPAI